MDASRRFVFSVAAAALLLPLGGQFSLPTARAAHPHEAASRAADPVKLNAARSALRDLWIGHVFWTRNVVAAELAHNPAAQRAAESEVLRNARALADAVTPYYGAAASQKLYGLLGGHYGAVKSYLDASVAKSPDGQSRATADLTDNAGDIAAFLSGANPYLQKDTLENLLQAHGGHHIAQIQQLQAKNYTEEAQTWTDMSQHMYVIADAMADALARQFPEKF